MVKFTEQEYKNEYGEDISIISDGLDDNSNKTNRNINMACNRIYLYITKTSTSAIPDDDDLSTLQTNNIKKAEMAQLYYMFNNGDIANESGVDESGVHIDMKTLRNVAISPIAKDYLQTCGLLNKGFNSYRHSNDPYWWFY